MTKITNPKQCIGENSSYHVLVIEISNFEFICDLMLVIWNLPETRKYESQKIGVILLLIILSNRI